MKSEPIEIMAQNSKWETQGGNFSNENYLMTIRFADGSIGQIFNTDLSTQSFPKEHIEIFAGDHVFEIKNFESSMVNQHGRIQTLKTRDKGFYKELDLFADAILNNDKLLVTEVDGIRATICALTAVHSISSNQPKPVELNEILK